MQKSIQTNPGVQESSSISHSLFSFFSSYLQFQTLRFKEKLKTLKGFNYLELSSYKNLWKDKYHKRKIIVALSIIILFLVYAVLTSFVYPSRKSQLSAYSSDWNDISDFREAIKKNGYKVKNIQSNPTALWDYFHKEMEKEEEHFAKWWKLSPIFEGKEYNAEINSTLLLIIGLERAYTSLEKNAIIEFVKQGGNLLLADDFGYGNTIAKEFGVGFTNYKLYDRNYEKNTAFIKATATTPFGKRTVLLNEPSTLFNVGESFLILSSGEDSFIDKNGNELEDSDEGGGNFPLCVFTEYGDGRVILISDPGLFINNMLSRYENRAFALDLIKMLLPSGGEVIFDESSHISPDYLSSSVHFLLTTLYKAKTSIFFHILFLMAATIFYELAVIFTKPPLKLFRAETMKNLASNVRYLKKNLAKREKIKEIFLEKVRVGLRMNKEEFSKISEEELISIINNRDISRFLFEEDLVVSPQDYPYFFNLMKNWSIAW